MSHTRAKKLKHIARRKFVPKRYQRRCIKFGLSRPEAGFLLAPGLGKTAIVLFMFKILRKLGIVDTLFVLSKKSIIYEVWPREMKKWKGLEKLRPSIVHGDRAKALRSKKANVFLMNFEGLDWLRQKEQRWFFKDRKTMLVVDESSKLRNTSTLRFKSLKKILHRFDRRHILTGSPAPKGLMNLFGQIYTLDMGKRLGKFITHFRNQYFEPAGYMAMEWKPQKNAEKRIFKKIKPIVIRFGEDELDLPPLLFVKRKVKLPRKKMLAYKKMEKELILQYREGTIVAANAAVASSKCRQIANGAVYYEAGVDDKGKPIKKWRHMHDAKLESLVDLLEELNGEPALVAYEFKPEKVIIQKYLAKHAPQFKNAPFIDGKTKPKELKKYVRQWERGDLPVMFANTEVASHGLNLQGKGGIVIYYALTWNLENFEQFYKRVHRQGQTRRVIVYLIIAKGTVDEVILYTLKNRDKGQKRILKAMERKYGRRKRVRAVDKKTDKKLRQARKKRRAAKKAAARKDAS